MQVSLGIKRVFHGAYQKLVEAAHASDADMDAKYRFRPGAGGERPRDGEFRILRLKKRRNEPYKCDVPDERKYQL